MQSDKETFERKVRELIKEQSLERTRVSSFESHSTKEVIKASHEEVKFAAMVSASDPLKTSSELVKNSEVFEDIESDSSLSDEEEDDVIKYPPSKRMKIE